MCESVPHLACLLILLYKIRYNMYKHIEIYILAHNSNSKSTTSGHET